MLDRGLNKIKRSSNNLILFGEVGSGKTTLLNKLCGTNYEAREGGYSCTRDIQHALSKDKKNIIVDCPGLNAAEDITQHLKVQKFILSIIPIRIIGFVIKYSERYDLLIRAAARMFRIFHEHKNNIAIIITFSEELGNSQMKEIQNIFKAKFSIDEDKVIFSSNDIESSEILRRINIIKRNVLNINSIKFNEQSLLSKNEEGGLEIVEFRENKMKEYKKIINILKSRLDEEYEPQIKKALLETIKYYINDLIISFKEKLKTKIQDIDTINVDSLIFSNELDELLNIIADQYENELSNIQLGREDNSPIYYKYIVQKTNNFNLDNQTETINNYYKGQFKDFVIQIDLDDTNIKIIKNKNSINNTDHNKQKKSNNITSINKNNNKDSIIINDNNVNNKTNSEELRPLYKKNLKGFPKNSTDQKKTINNKQIFGNINGTTSYCYSVMKNRVNKF
jgi:hypothetical protein